MMVAGGDWFLKDVEIFNGNNWEVSKLKIWKIYLVVLKLLESLKYSKDEMYVEIFLPLRIKT